MGHAGGLLTWDKTMTPDSIRARGLGIYLAAPIVADAPKREHHTLGSHASDMNAARAHVARFCEEQDRLRLVGERDYWRDQALVARNRERALRCVAIAAMAALVVVVVLAVKP